MLPSGAQGAGNDPGTAADERQVVPWLLAIVLPMALIVVLLGADALEGPKTAYVGVLAVVPMLAAVFGSPLSTAVVSVVTWLSALAFGLVASDGNAAAQTVRLVILALISGLAVIVSGVREQRERRLKAAERTAAQARHLAELAEVDQLTQIPNRRGVLRRASQTLHRPERTVALIDVDNLKTVNDEHGHQVGDAYIKAVAQRVRAAVASTDAVGRWGGDEFLVVLDLPLASGRAVLERVHGVVISQPVATGGVDLPVAVSVGAASWHADDDSHSFDDALRRADEALYSAKHAGRNQVVIGT